MGLQFSCFFALIVTSISLLIANSVLAEETAKAASQQAPAVSSASSKHTADSARKVLRAGKRNPKRLLQQLKGDRSLLTALDGFEGDCRELCELVEGRNPQYQEISAFIRQSPDIPALLALHLNHCDAVKHLLGRAENNQYFHKRVFYSACARALGSKPRYEVVIAPANVPYSKWFEVQGLLEEFIRQAKAQQTRGHGDGRYLMIVTGEIVQATGGHPQEIKILRYENTLDGRAINDGRIYYEVEVSYDFVTGRFYFQADVFAASAVGFVGLYSTAPLDFEIIVDGHPTVGIHAGPQPPHLKILLPAGTSEHSNDEI